MLITVAIDLHLIWHSTIMLFLVACALDEHLLKTVTICQIIKIAFFYL